MALARACLVAPLHVGARSFHAAFAFAARPSHFAPVFADTSLTRTLFVHRSAMSTSVDAAAVPAAPVASAPVAEVAAGTPAPAAGGAGAAASSPVAADKKKKEAKPAVGGAGAPAAGGAGAAADAKKKEKKAIEKLDFVNTTPAGDKKDMSAEMLPAYHPAAVEAAWDAWWTKAGYYAGNAPAAEAAGEGGRFVMVIPPPNVTGSLHLGHALTSAVEDCMTRWNRMRGRPTLWLPGTDHAGIATQAVVEKRLAKERGVSRHDLGREAFIEEVWGWKETYGSRITSQQRHLGISADWGRERFTMDPMLSTAVQEAFVRLSEMGLVYRDTKLVNWCCRLKTAISDIEVEYIDLEKRTRLTVPGHDPAKTYEFGVITSFAYKVAARADGSVPAPGSGEEEIVVATTRPETMLGDVAVAVHPDDARYKSLQGARLIHPFFPDRVVTVITDGELVDPAFGTGAVKITPAHDPNDYKCGKKHGLAFITVINETGAINEAGGPFAGMMRFDARLAVLKALEERGLLRGKADNKMRLGLCSRSGDVIEPLIKPQWYVKCAGMAKAAADAVRGGELRILPAMHESTWFSWLDNIQDWCISRQLWWGHRIPAYFVSVAGAPAGDDADPKHWVVGRTEDEARAAAAARFGVAPESVSLRQDEDVLDTWFSSGLFPFATLGWPNTEHPDFKAFYPNTILETGHDILFFWVARMVMMGITLTGQLPFKTVYLHAMVRDKYGRKMSKSLGNVIDPMEVIAGCDLETLHSKIREGNLPAKEVETAIKGQKLDFPDGIPECGADALRFGLLAYTVQGRDVNLDINRVVAYRQFCNKLWNATRFALAHLAPGKYEAAPLLDMVDELAGSESLATRDRWILSRLAYTVTAVTGMLGEYDFGRAAQALYDFWLYDLCDYYLELMKPLMNGDADAAAAAGGDVATAQRLSRMTLHLCLDQGLKLLHPFMPFVTEELWQRLPGRGKPWRAAAGGPADPPSIMIATWPALPAALRRPEVEAQFEAFQGAVRRGRALRVDADIAPSKEAVFYMAAKAGSPAAGMVADQRRDLMTLLRASDIHVVSASSEVEEGCSAATVNESLSVHLLLKGLINPAQEVEKLTKRVANLAKELERVQKKMAVASYKDKVPEEVQVADAEALRNLAGQIEVLEGLKASYAKWSA